MRELRKIFEKVASNNLWSDPHSLSGPGSNLTQTYTIRKKIPLLVEKYKIKSFLDAPCGDLFWMQEILPKLTGAGVIYTGIDVVNDIVNRNKQKFENSKTQFYCCDLTKDKLPNVDIIFTRDCFIHLSYKNILFILKNYKNSGSKYLLVSTYANPARKNVDVNHVFIPGRAINLQKFPFFFPKPLELITENCTELNGEYFDKSLGLWKISDLPLFLTEIMIFYTRTLKKIHYIIIKIKKIIEGEKL